MTRRSRTPSDVKWLANELAATGGELKRIERELARLRARRRRLMATRASLARVAEMVAFPSLQDLVQPVQAHPAYGHRGRLREFLRQALRSAHPRALDSFTLAEAAARQFESAFASPEERLHFCRRLVTHSLRKLVAAGEVQRLHLTVGNTVGVWRWNESTPTLEDLRSRAQEVAPWP
jgi:hypothetical protein